MYEDLGVPEKRVVGTKQLLRELQKGSVRTVFVAKDADDFLYRRVTAAAAEHHAALVKVDTMKELGRMCRLQVDAAAAGLRQ